MKVLNCGIALAVGALALGLAGGAGAQENLDRGKSGAQLFASDCASCHKTTAGLSKGRVLGLESFLREHYTASRESAAAVAAYVQATDKGPPPPARAKKKGAGMGAGQGDDKAKGTEKKPGAANSGDAKPVEAKPSGAKPSGAKPSESKPSENKPSDGRPPDIYQPEKKSN
jgi:hypothetical protein